MMHNIFVKYFVFKYGYKFVPCFALRCLVMVK